MKILVAIPCYKCAPQIQRVLASFDEKLLRRVHEIVVFDNRSPDDTLAAARNAAAALKQRFPFADYVHVYENNENYGLGGTQKISFLHAEKGGFDYVAILHGDNQAQTQELNDLLDIAERNPKLDAVLGARFMPGSRLQGYSRMRTLGNRALNWLYQILCWRTTYDLGSGLNLFKVSSFKDHGFLGHSDGFTFNMDLLLDLYRKKCQLQFLPITWSETDQVSNAKMLRVGWITLVTLLRWRFGWRTENRAVPLRYLSTQVQ